MHPSLLVGLAAILALGVGAQWVSWRLRLPSILLLLMTGFIAGPVTGFLSPDDLFGDLLLPVVSLSVGLIMFEGGLTLRFTDIKETGSTVRNLIVLGAVITWVGSSIAAIVFLNLDYRLALLLGAVLIVTGPTVIIPLLRQIRPQGHAGNILKWEGILIDPVGATLALLVFESISAAETSEATIKVIEAIVLTIVVGVALGVSGAIVMTQTLRRYWIPDYLQNPVNLAVVVAVFTASNIIQHESGLLAVTVMGIYLANQKRVEIRHILEFKENLQVLLIAGLFIVLAARLELDDLRGLPPGSWAFLAFLILVLRPLATALATYRSKLSWQERVFVGGLAPRGIVAAAVSSVFALQLEEAGIEDAGMLVSLTFFVIMGTVLVYGLGAGPLARWLGLSSPDPQGLLMVGASDWARAIAVELKKHDIPIVMADTNYQQVRAARMAGIKSYFGNVLSEHAGVMMDLGGTGRVLALTPNDEINSLSAMHFVETFGRGQAFQLASQKSEDRPRETMVERLRGRELFNAKATFRDLSRLHREGATLRSTALTKEFNFDQYKKYYGEFAIPLFLLDAEGRLRVFTVKDPPKPQTGQTIIALIRSDFVPPEPPEKEDEDESEEEEN